MGIHLRAFASGCAACIQEDPRIEAFELQVGAGHSFHVGVGHSFPLIIVYFDHNLSAKHYEVA